ncbi:MAG TPA: excinuclease ABC subunit UvrC [Victivallales bacterium]|nr:excinuclease ABC subunit UvrC [Victivallales bacterium]
MTDKAFSSSDIPAKPGVYIYRDRFGKVIYIGKAVNLRKRMAHYFQASKKTMADPKLRSLVNSINSWEYRVVKNESEALLLESRLIKEYAPYYNILMRDDKRYFLIKINVNEKYPKLHLARLRKNDGAKYYGPFPRGGVLKQTIEFLSSYFKLRMCNSNIPGLEDRKYCMEARIKKCSEPCAGKISEAAYKEKVTKLIKLFDGNIKDIVAELSADMTNLSAKMQFEKAAIRRDMIDNITNIFGKRGRNFRFATLNNSSGEDYVNDLQNKLGLKKKPNLIEAFDISNLSDEIAVASLVCFENGYSANKKYRRFKIKTVDGINDFAMMQEVIGRHYRRLQDENGIFPNLLMVDGGKGQLSSAIKALIDLKIPSFPVIGLAKKNEEIFLPGRSEPIILDKNSLALKLLQSIRDEAHRFAISYNRELRLKKINESILDDIPGIGFERKKAILHAFSSIGELRNSTPEQLVKKVNNIGLTLAESILFYLNKN